ncbi:MAG: Crp/Fnr family transcriptional regulator [Muribaculaceae bacterium]|jgi:CRP-like cAMP-binding protein|nr:Crp/Fnr family transcriptional regulator [Muribaculaceae bacterium]MBQ1185877.1 Crp/Fnr family transcriptional regulator [Muribaculaceae bacterium]MBQ2370600.1 Crp/Fnr family transcriptional regulator [Muribaculaceae bacterium]MBQ2399798.1 Crp/Fnr family transcriptional regulator [Muribaculaceae bacterium]MBQ5722571.1 Crp/Fnr family transcriptional regulator [Muribaculaceae bacterium]
MIRKSELEAIIKKDLSELWKVLTPEDKRVVVENFSVRSFKKNQIIYAENDEPMNLWILLDGKVKMYKNGVGDRTQILRLFRPVQYFGYRAYFAREAYVSSVAAFEASTLGYIPMKIVEQLIRKNNDLAMFFIHELSRNLGGSDTKIVNLTQKHIRGRLAEAILILRDNYGLEDDNQTLKIYMSREDLANLSNMTTSNAIRTLSGFVNEKLIVVDGRRIKITNEYQLRQIARFG